MKSKNNSIETIEQINKNLKEQFPGENFYCTGIETGNFQHLYFIKSNRCEFAVADKMVFIPSDPERIKKYVEYCNRTKALKIKKQFKMQFYIPFIWDHRNADENQLEEENKILIACGLKKEKQSKKETDIERLKVIGGKTFVEIYKMIQKVNVTGYYFDDHFDQYNNIERLIVEHETGRFAFPISLPADESYPWELKNIFLNILHIQNKHAA